jgi:hypothetical protein
MKGVENDGASSCNDSISIADGTVTANTYVNDRLVNTDPGGAYTKVTYKFSLDSIKPGDLLLAQINSTACTNGDHGDDFEFTNVLGKLSQN